jgi:hypothetical protein
MELLTLSSSSPRSCWGSVHPTVKLALVELTSVQLALLWPVFACAVLMGLLRLDGVRR